MLTVEEALESAGPGLELAHGWLLHALEPISPAEAEAVLRGPAAAVPDSLAARLGALRIYAAAYLECRGEQEWVSAAPPAGESHSSLWLERPEGLALLLSFRDADAHDTGFELLAALGELVVPRLTDEEFVRYAQLIERELREGVTGEIDEESLEAREAAQADYVMVSLASTLAEYMHALWHDVEVRQGPEHLAPQFLRRRLELLQEMFPPNPGYILFR